METDLTHNRETPGLNPPIATVSKFGHFRSLHDAPVHSAVSMSTVVLDSGGNVSDLVVACNCCVARMLPREVELVSE